MIYLLFLFSLFFLTSTQAASFPSYYCEKHYQTVQIGDSTDVVRAACGDPATVNTRETPTNAPVNIVHWVYTPGFLRIKNSIFNLPAVAITLRDQKVTELYRAGAPVTDATCALNGTIAINDTAEKVLQTCGQPNYTQNAQENVATNKSLTEWIYNNGPYRPQIIFDFENSKLIQITSGQLGK